MRQTCGESTVTVNLARYVQARYPRAASPVLHAVSFFSADTFASLTYSSASINLRYALWRFTSITIPGMLDTHGVRLQDGPCLHADDTPELSPTLIPAVCLSHRTSSSRRASRSPERKQSYWTASDSGSTSIPECRSFDRHQGTLPFALDTLTMPLTLPHGPRHGVTSAYASLICRRTFAGRTANHLQVSRAIGRVLDSHACPSSARAIWTALDLMHDVIRLETVFYFARWIRHGRTEPFWGSALRGAVGCIKTCLETYLSLSRWADRSGACPGRQLRQARHCKFTAGLN